MLEIVRHNLFKKDVKLARKRGKALKNLSFVLETLSAEEDLPVKYRPHKLSGNYKDCWECHVEPDHLLVYFFTEQELYLVRLGTHSDLF